MAHVGCEGRVVLALARVIVVGNFEAVIGLEHIDDAHQRPMNAQLVRAELVMPGYERFGLQVICSGLALLLLTIANVGDGIAKGATLALPNAPCAVVLMLAL